MKKLTVMVNVIALGWALAHNAAAQTFTWSGETGGQWNDATNWEEGAPVSGGTTAIVIDTQTFPSMTNDIPGGLTLNSLFLGPNSGVRTIGGNPLTFDGANPSISALNESGSGVSELLAPLILQQTVTVTGGASFPNQLIARSGAAISGPGGITLIGGIFATNSGSNSFSGGVLVEGGLYGGSSTAAFGDSTNVSIQSGGSIQLFGRDLSFAVPQAISIAGAGSALAGNYALAATQGGTKTVQGLVSLTDDAAVSAFTGTGTLDTVAPTLTTILRLAGGVALGGNTLTANAASGARVEATGATTGTGGISATGAGTISLTSVNVDGLIRRSGSGGSFIIGSLAGTGRLEIDYASPAGTAVVSGVFSGNRDIEVANGTLTLSNTSNSFSGEIVLRSPGATLVAFPVALGNAANPVAFEGGGVWRTQTGGDITRNISTENGTGRVEFNFGTANLQGQITGGGGLTLAHSSFGQIVSVTLSGNNSFGGGLTLETGVAAQYSPALDAGFGNAGGQVRLNGGRILLSNDTAEFARPVEVSATGGSMVRSNAAPLDVAGDLSGAGVLQLFGPTGAVFESTGTNSHGGFAISGSSNGARPVLAIDSDARLGAAGVALDIGAGSGFNIRPATLRATADLDIAATRSTIFQSMAVDTNGFDVTFNQPISGTGMLKLGEGAWTLNTANTSALDNTVTIQQGTLRVGVDHALGSRGLIGSMGADTVLDLNDFDLDLRSVANVSPSAEIRLGSGALNIIVFSQIAGTISGEGSVVIGKEGLTHSGSTFTGDNTFSGGLTIHEGGSLSIDRPAALGATGNAIHIDGGLLGTNFFMQEDLFLDGTRPLTVGAGGVTFEVNKRSTAISQQLGGSFPLAVRGGSDPSDSAKFEVRLLNGGNTFAGKIRVGELGLPGVLGIASDRTLGDVGNLLTLGDTGSSFGSGGLRALDDLHLPDLRSIQIGGSSPAPKSVIANAYIDTNGFDVRIDGTIGESTPGLRFAKTGAGALILNGTNTFTGGTTVQQGILTINGSLADATMAIQPDSTVNGTGTLTFNVDGATSDQIVMTGGTLTTTGLTVNVNGSLTEPEYVIVDATSGGTISGTFAGLTGATGYALSYDTAGQVKLVGSPTTSPFETWAGPGVDFDGDENGDGVANGLAFLLGADGPNDKALGLLPTVTEDAGGLVLTFQMLAAAARGSASLTLDHSNSVAPDSWTSVAVPDTSSTVDDLVFTITITGTGPLSVTATIPLSKAADGKLFARLKAENP